METPDNDKMTARDVAAYKVIVRLREFPLPDIGGKREEPIGYAVPIGGGWGFACVDCYNDPINSDEDRATCEPMFIGDDLPAGGICDCGKAVKS